jgi:DNA mismatch repair protein MutS
MQQYVETKADYPDHIVLFRMGDFYETFYDDAKKASQILGITLTARDKERKVPMAGIPYHALDNYLSKLIDANQKVVLVEQLEDPKLAKGVVKRGIVRIFTPGTTPLVKELRKSIFLTSVYIHSKTKFEIAFAETDDGVIRFVEFNNLRDLISNLLILSPKEIVLSKELKDSDDAKAIEDALKKILINYEVEDLFNHQKAHDVLLNSAFTDQLKKSKKKSVFGIVNYLAETQRVKLNHLISIREYSTRDFVKLDYNVVKSLELIDGLRPDAVPLLEILDRCSTIAGSKLLRQWLITPLVNPDEIKARQSKVAELKNLGIEFIKSFQEKASHIIDLNRISTRIGLGSANARDLRNLVESIKVAFEIAKNFKEKGEALNYLLKTSEDILNEIQSAQTILAEINSTISETPPITVREGDMIKSGFSKELDELHDLKTGGKDWIKNFETEEIARTKINTLKVRYNKVFGYYIEISNSQIAKTPDNYIKKQTLVNAERFITPELKEYEAKVLGAEERINKLEYDIFINLLKKCEELIPSLQRLNDLIASLDIFASFADTAIECNWTMPEMHDGYEISIQNGRHPVVEHMLRKTGKSFVSNSYSSNESSTLEILTGPNMGGKSTYLRQIALIVILAQIGSFVPAEKAKLSIVDKLFTRIGASDNLSGGESTFMVEMLEAAEIVKNSTDKSLVILDEVGRGTSTFDGMSIAWAICEYLAQKKCKTLFATHYHELTELANKYSNVQNLAVKVVEYKGEIVFMHQIYSGKADRSYGIHVAKLAGMPNEIIKKSEQVLKILEKEKNKLQPSPQDLFAAGDSVETSESNEIITRLQNLDPDKLSPIEAWQELNSITQELNKSVTTR